MLTATQIEATRAYAQKNPDGLLVLTHITEPREDVHLDRDEWLEILDLAAMAARIRER